MKKENLLDEHLKKQFVHKTKNMDSLENELNQPESKKDIQRCISWKYFGKEFPR